MAAFENHETFADLRRLSRPIIVNRTVDTERLYRRRISVRDRITSGGGGHLHYYSLLFCNYTYIIWCVRYTVCYV